MAEKIIGHSDFYYHGKLPFLRKRCPGLSEEKLNEAEELFIEYVTLALKTCDQMAKESESINTRKEIKEYLERLEIDR